MTESQGMTLSDIPVMDGAITHFALWVRDLAGNKAPYTARLSDQTFSRRATLAAWWKFDGNANDSSASGVNGSIVGPTVFVADSVYGQAFNFAGNDNASNYILTCSPFSVPVVEGKPHAVLTINS